MNDFALAFRNLFRQRRRTALALSAIGFGVTAYLLAGGFIEWIFWAMRESTIKSQLGHVQVVRQGFVEQGAADPFPYLFPGPQDREPVLEGITSVRAVAPRVGFSGLISRGDTTVSFVGEGIDAAREGALGQYFQLVAGRALAEGDVEGVMLGEGLAKILGATPGDRVVLLATTASGGINALEMAVRGVFYTSNKAMDDVALRVPLVAAHQLIRSEGVHRWLILLDDTARTNDVAALLRARFAATGADIEVIPWYRMADFYNKTVELFSRQMGVVAVIIALIIVLSISNTMVMSVFERTREIGTLLALGRRRRQVLTLYLQEGVVLGAVGGALGMAVGMALAGVLTAVGIPMPPPPGMNRGFTGEILLTWPLVGGGLALALASTVLASLYPAWKASRLEIVEALRHGR